MTIDNNPFSSLRADIMPKQAGSLNKLELTSIYALVAYAAYHRNISQDVIAQTVSQHFGVDDVAQLPRKSYDEVVKFLVDIQIDMLLH